MDFGKIVTLIIGLLGSPGVAADIIKLLLQLFAKIAPLIPTTTPAVEMDVKWAQQALAKLGFDPGVIDGVMGPKTIAAIGAYQTARGLIVDHWLGSETQTKLRMETGGT